MSQRLALIQLHNELLLRRMAEHVGREGLERQLERLKLGGTTLREPESPPNDDTNLGQPALDALRELADAPAQAQVAPIETLQLLVALSQALRSSGGLQALPEQDREAVEDVARSLLEDDAGDPTSLLQVIDSIPEDDGVIRVRGFDERFGLARVTGPRPPPRELAGQETVGDVLRQVGDTIGVPTPQLVASLDTHPVVDVEARIYRAVIDGQAEYPVHIRTTIQFGGRGEDDLSRFERIFDPSKWPVYNSFWKVMEEVPPGSSAAAIGAAPDVLQAVLMAAAAFDLSIAHFADDWAVVGTYWEKVGFEDGADLYPDTYLNFAVRPRVDRRSILSYALADRSLSALGVDDGCIELTLSNTGIDVVTTKSLYVSGAGADTELAGILAYIAVYAGWGTHTLALVSNASK